MHWQNIIFIYYLFIKENRLTLLSFSHFVPRKKNNKKDRFKI